MGLLIVIILIFIIINYIGSNNNSDYKTNTSNKYDSGVTSNKYNPKVNNKKSESQKIITLDSKTPTGSPKAPPLYQNEPTIRLKITPT